MINTVNLLSGLNEYLFLAKGLKKIIEPNHGTEVVTSISLCYDTIKLKFDNITGQMANQGTLQTETLLTCSFQIKGTLVTLNEIHCQKTLLENEVRGFILDHFSGSGMTWGIDTRELPYSAETVRYVSIADRIAKEVYFCDAGDAYRPGYFSEIILEHEALIILRQINRHNSRSIDHKKDYFMRELEFFIPLKPGPKKLSFDEDTIGEMRIRFFDHSTQNNQKCGDRIREKIRDEKSNF